MVNTMVYTMVNIYQWNFPCFPITKSPPKNPYLFDPAAGVAASPSAPRRWRCWPLGGGGTWCSLGRWPGNMDISWALDWFCWENLHETHGFLPSNIGISFPVKFPIIQFYDMSIFCWEYDQWPFQEPIDWRYLPYIRPIFQAYVREYPHKIWPCMVQYLQFRILEFPLIWWRLVILQDGNTMKFLWHMRFRTELVRDLWLFIIVDG